MPNDTNLQILLKSRPDGRIVESDFETRRSPTPEVGEGQALIKNLFLSLDPAMRGWVREGESYIEPVKLGDVMRGFTVGIVTESKTPELQPGDKVTGMHGWQELTVVGRGTGIKPTKLPEVPLPLSNFLGVLGGTGLTAYFGLLDIGEPKEGETVLVSTAAGAVGSIVGQIAKIKGCRVVGITGSDEKCRWITEELGYDAAINYKTDDLNKAIRRTCPDKVDVYFDNVGGAQLDAALANLNKHARVVICGAISIYNAKGEPPPGPSNYLSLLIKSARMQGFVILDYVDRFMEGGMQLGQWVMEGKIKHREHVVDGLEQAPSALNMLFDGTNIGKLVVKIADA